MTDLILFLSASALLLAAPGPTNTLLGVSGALVGIRRSLGLLVAECVAYTLSIGILVVFAAPLIQQVPVVGMILRGVSALYLSWAAVSLWRKSHQMVQALQRISSRQVFFATLLNPKGLVIAFALVPSKISHASIQVAGYIAALCIVIAAIGLAWICLGAMFGRTTKANDALMSKIGAGALATFALILTASLV